MYQVEDIGSEGHPIEDDLGIVLYGGLVQYEGHGKDAEAYEKTQHEQPVTVVEAVKRKAGPASEGVSPALHTVGNLYEVLQAPGEYDGSLPEDVYYSSQDMGADSVSVISTKCVRCISPTQFCRQCLQN